MSLRLLTRNSFTAHSTIAHSKKTKDVQLNTKFVQHSQATNNMSKMKIIGEQKAHFSTSSNTNANPLAKASTPKLMVLGGNDMGNFQVLPLEQDTTAKVYFHNAPNDSEEDKETATALGFNSFFMARHSYYSIKFEQKHKDMSLDTYVDMLKLDFYSRVPYGTTSTVQLDPELTSHLSPFEFSAIFFDKKSRPDAVQRSAELTLILKSPGGFWSVCCFGSWLTLASQKEVFFGALLRSLKAELLLPEAESIKVEQKQDIQQALHNAMEKTSIKMRKRPSKKNTKDNEAANFMKQAPIGVLNVKQEKATLDDDLN